MATSNLQALWNHPTVSGTCQSAFSSFLPSFSRSLQFGLLRLFVSRCRCHSFSFQACAYGSVFLLWTRILSVKWALCGISSTTLRSRAQCVHWARLEWGISSTSEWKRCRKWKWPALFVAFLSIVQLESANCPWQRGVKWVTRRMPSWSKTSPNGLESYWTSELLYLASIFQSNVGISQEGNFLPISPTLRNRCPVAGR